MQNLNRLELALLDKISKKYPQVKEHIPFLKVKSREITGVGMYVNFYYLDNQAIEKLNIPNTSISTDEYINLNNLKYGLAWEVDIAEGKINFIELVTYGEDWNGIIDDFKFE